jgi:hypothetical protein
MEFMIRFWTLLSAPLKNKIIHNLTKIVLKHVLVDFKRKELFSAIKFPYLKHRLPTFFYFIYKFNKINKNRKKKR